MGNQQRTSAFQDTHSSPQHFMTEGPRHVCLLCHCPRILAAMQPCCFSGGRVFQQGLAKALQRLEDIATLPHCHMRQWPAARETAWRTSVCLQPHAARIWLLPGVTLAHNLPADRREGQVSSADSPHDLCRLAFHLLATGLGRLCSALVSKELSAIPKVQGLSNSPEATICISFHGCQQCYA